MTKLEIEASEEFHKKSLIEDAKRYAEELKKNNNMVQQTSPECNTVFITDANGFLMDKRTRIVM